MMKRIVAAGAAFLLAVWLPGCKSAGGHRAEADRAVAEIVGAKQQEALGRVEPFTIERPEETLRNRLLLEQELPVAGPASLGTEHVPRIRHLPPDEGGTEVQAGWPEEGGTLAEAPLRVSMLEALGVAARGSRAYQTRKENVFIDALRLDLERDFFRGTLTGVVSGQAISDLGPPQDTGGVIVSPNIGATQRFLNGMTLSARLAVDVVKLLTGDRDSSLGMLADTTVSLPLLRGAGRHIVAEPLAQAERNVVYSIWDFENFKRSFAVDVAREYLTVLQLLEQVHNAEENYRRLITSTRRARRLADAGRLDEVQVDQSIQQELRARERWIAARESHQRRLDAFKVQLGLPPDAMVELDQGELERLQGVSERMLTEVEETVDPVPPADAPVELAPPGLGTPGPLEMADDAAVRVALEHRLDLRIAEGQVFDAQRRVVVAADALRPGLSVSGSASLGARRAGLGSAALGDARLRFDEGLYSAGVTLDLPLERTAERNAYRISLINLERAVRTVQEAEDGVKLAVRNTLGSLLQARESLHIQARALAVAQRRVESTTLFLEAGRVQIRDLLEAQEALITAQNAFTAALITYRIGELQLQRDLGVLEVSEEGLWREYDPARGEGPVEPAG